MAHEAELPGETVNDEQWQMICCRYYNSARYVSGKRALEIGCGAGLGLGYLARQAAEVVGGDASEENVDLARAHYGDRVKLTVLDAHKIPFTEGSFDVIMAMEVIQYLDLPVFLAECARILKPGCRLILCQPNPEIPGFYPSRLSRRYYNSAELLSTLSRHGFQPDILGAFPVMRTNFWEGLRARAIIGTGKILDILPGGARLKAYLNRIVIGRTIIIKPEITEADMVPERLTVTPLAPGSADRRHRILYAVASRFEQARLL